MVEYLQVGAVASVHGVHGEVKVFPMTDDVNRFKKLKEVIIISELFKNGQIAALTEAI